MAEAVGVHLRLAGVSEPPAGLGRSSVISAIVSWGVSLTPKKTADRFYTWCRLRLQAGL
jgi:hypothetical protein